MHCSPPGSSVYGILQTRILEWVAISLSNVYFSSSSLVAKSCPTLATPQTVACQAPRSMEFSRQEYWSGLPFPSPRDLPDPGIEPRSPALQVDSLLSEPPGMLVKMYREVKIKYWRKYVPDNCKCPQFK